MKGAILNKGEKYYTYLGKVFAAIKDEQLKYNWLITEESREGQACGIALFNRDYNEIIIKKYKLAFWTRLICTFFVRYPSVKGYQGCVLDGEVGKGFKQIALLFA